MLSDPHDVTALLLRVRAGDERALDSLVQATYQQLRGMARAEFASGGRGARTLQPTALVHEAWVKLVGHVGDLRDRRHFYAVAARAMRQVLADHARACRSDKRGGGAPRMQIHDGIAQTETGIDPVGLDDCLNRLARLSEQQSRIVEMRFFGGLSVEETAEELGISRSSVESGWRMARAWLHRELGGS